MNNNNINTAKELTTLLKWFSKYGRLVILDDVGELVQNE